MNDEWAVTASGIVKRFGDRRVVDGVDIMVPRGSVYGVLGPNGAGKTTTLRMLLGIIEPDEGSRTLLGYDNPRDASDRVGYLPEERGLYPAMKAREAIAFLGALRGLDWKTGRARAVEMLEQAGLGHATDQKVRRLSKGMAQFVQLLIDSVGNHSSFVDQQRRIIVYFLGNLVADRSAEVQLFSYFSQAFVVGIQTGILDRLYRL